MRATVKPLALLFPSSLLHRTKHAKFVTPQIYFSFPSKTLVATKTRTQTLAFLFPRRAMAAAASPPSVQVRETIELTDVETKIFDRLLGTLRHFGLQSQLRVAGGWVRDKVRLSFSFFCLVGKKIAFFVWLICICLRVVVDFGFSASRQRMLRH